MRASLRYGRGPERRRRGSAIIEFTLAGTFIFLPLLAGLATVGMSMVTAMQAENLNATAGQMFSSGSWSSSQLQTALPAMAGTLNTSTSGSGVVILSEIDDTTNGFVCSNQITITLGTAGYGGTSQYCSAGNVLNAPLAMVAGQTAYVAETYYSNPQFAWAFAPAGTGTGIYEKAIF